MLNEILRLAAQDAREFMDDSPDVDCDCNADKACGECIDGGLYDGAELPQPPPFIVVDSPWNEEDERAMHTFIHCENEQECRFCNPSKPTDYQIDGPKSCENYYNSCGCNACNQRDTWYANEVFTR